MPRLRPARPDCGARGCRNRSFVDGAHSGTNSWTRGFLTFSSARSARGRSSIGGRRPGCCAPAAERAEPVGNSAPTHRNIPAAVERGAHQAVMTRGDHATGTDRIAEVVERLGLAADSLVVNVQGDEPMIEPGLIRAVATLLAD